MIEHCWSRRPYGVGLATGPAGLVVIDLDLPKDKDPKDTPYGVQTFKALCERAGQPVPVTRSVRTASGGRHLYFTAPPGTRMGSSRGRLGKLIDTRAWGGYVLAPSQTIAAGRYEVEHDVPVASLPEWLCAALAPAPRPTRSVLPQAACRAGAYVAAAFRAETGAVAAAPEGARNWTLTRAARALGRFVAAGDLTRSEVEEALKGAGQLAGLSVGEAQATITNALNWSIANNPAVVRVPR